MPKHYEALQRAEQERRRKATGADAPAPASVSFEGPARPVTRAKAGGLLSRLFRGRKGAGLEESNEGNKRRIALLQPDSFVAEQYRSLRGRIDALAAQRPLKTLAVTSANAGEGKSTCAVNLATVNAMSVGRSVLLIDCDLRRPKVHWTLGLQPQVGLAEILSNQATLDEAIQKLDGVNLDVLPVRSVPPNPSELLASPEMRKLIEEIAGRYDRVVLDTPACLGLPDAKSISELCDGLVMVVRADVTPQEEVQAALDILDRRRVVGLVLNGSEASREQYGYY
ncbi:MAG: CpsD/CapB family tyrosine-protein kinase [bacterium]|nr:capsular biosynthesis protein [Deltaproteobacteria bacterium]MCP4905549.1 CpsD/CapB family tyrosine-protein kinase [bacterium]